MHWTTFLAIVMAVGLTIYLTVALLLPEKSFQTANAVLQVGLYLGLLFA